MGAPKSWQPTTAMEHNLLRQVEGLEGKLERQRIHYEQVIADMKAARAPTPRPRVVLAVGADSPEVTARIEAARRLGHAQATNAATAQIDALTEENSRLESRLLAGMERRTVMLYVCSLLLRLEDNERLSDAAWDDMMDRAVKLARTTVSLEVIARREDRARQRAKEAGKQTS